MWGDVRPLGYNFSHSLTFNWSLYIYVSKVKGLTLSATPIEAITWLSQTHQSGRSRGRTPLLRHYRPIKRRVESPYVNPREGGSK